MHLTSHGIWRGQKYGGNHTRNEWRRCKNYTRNGWRRLVNYTRSEWRTRVSFLPLNGAVSPSQLSWFYEQLKSAFLNCEKVIVMTHNVLHPSATSRKDCKGENYTRFECVFTSSPLVSSVVSGLLWNYDHILSILSQFSPGLVPLVLNGHAHRKAKYMDRNTGIFSTRFECIFTSSPLVSSVFLHLLHSFRV